MFSSIYWSNMDGLQILIAYFQWSTERFFRQSFCRKFRQKLFRFLQKENFQFRHFCRKRHFLAKGGVYAERSFFCRNQSLILLKVMCISAEIQAYFCRNTLFLQKQSLSAERAPFGSFGISAETNFFEMLSFGFLQKERNSLSVDHYLF